jgi:hypothetical protein
VRPPASAKARAHRRPAKRLRKDAATFQPGDILLEEGERGSKLIILIEGEIEVIRRDYLVDLQQQAAGRREDLDLVDKILATLFQKPQPAAKAKKPAKVLSK